MQVENSRGPFGAFDDSTRLLENSQYVFTLYVLERSGIGGRPGSGISDWFIGKCRVAPQE